MTPVKDLSDVELDLAIAESGIRFTAATLEKQRRAGARGESAHPSAGLIQEFFRRRPHLVALTVGFIVLMVGTQIMRLFK